MQLEALDIVSKVSDLTDSPFVTRELMIIKVRHVPAVGPVTVACCRRICASQNLVLGSNVTSAACRSDVSLAKEGRLRSLEVGSCACISALCCMHFQLQMFQDGVHIHVRSMSCTCPCCHAEIFHGRVIDLSQQTMTLELQGKEVRPLHRPLACVHHLRPLPSCFHLATGTAPRAVACGSLSRCCGACKVFKGLLTIFSY